MRLFTSVAVNSDRTRTTGFRLKAGSYYELCIAIEKKKLPSSKR
jgi:hypothetical protein